MGRRAASIHDQDRVRWQAVKALLLAALGKRKSRRSLLARPATTTPRMPMARARVNVSASTLVSTTRMVPASPTSRPAERRLPLLPVASWSLPGSGRRGVTIPANSAAAGGIVSDVPGLERRERYRPGVPRADPDAAGRHAPLALPAEQQLAALTSTHSCPGRPSSRPSRDQRSPGRASAESSTRSTPRCGASRSRSAMGAPTTTASPGFHQGGAIARCQAKDRVDGGVDQVPPGRNPGDIRRRVDHWT